MSLEFGQRSFFAIEGEPVVFLTVRRVGISYIDIPFTVSTHPTTATGYNSLATFSFYVMDPFWPYLAVFPLLYLFLEQFVRELLCN